MQLLPDEAATQRLGVQLAAALDGQTGVIYLQGGLGAGKTTLVRALLQALGVKGRVVSPTYTLIEPYNAGPNQVLHLDLYRLADPDELEFLGIRDLDPGTQLILVEWPEQGGGLLPEADLILHLDDADRGRQLRVAGQSDKGRGWWQAVTATMSQ